MGGGKDRLGIKNPDLWFTNLKQAATFYISLKRAHRHLAQAPSTGTGTDTDSQVGTADSDWE